MVQVLDLEKQEEIIIIIPEEELRMEEVPLKKQKLLRLSKYSKPAKYHEELIYINKLKAKLDANIYRNKINNF
ncbi:MAG: hypothetical protein ACFE75_13340 [Candidatus Hodarchaeota archaeon]